MVVPATVRSVNVPLTSRCVRVTPIQQQEYRAARYGTDFLHRPNRGGNQGNNTVATQLLPLPSKFLKISGIDMKEKGKVRGAPFDIQGEEGAWKYFKEAKKQLHPPDK